MQVPALGLGTWFLGENKAARAREMESLRTGISAGMTLIDTAEMYGNGKAESLIKEVISDKKRDDLFLVSKVLPNNAGKHRLEQALDNSILSVCSTTASGNCSRHNSRFRGVPASTDVAAAAAWRNVRNL